MKNLSTLPTSVYPLANMPYNDQLTAKTSKMLRIFGNYCKVSPIVAMAEPTGYRNSLTAYFGRGKGGKLVTGDFNPRNGHIFPVESYPLHQVELEKAMACVRAAANFCKYEVFSPENGKGMVRAVLLRYSKKQNSVMAVLVTGKAILPGAKNFVSKLRTLCQNQNVNISTVIQNVNEFQTNVLLGEREKVLFGKGFLVDEFCGKTFAISSETFFPVNLEQTENVYKTAMLQMALGGAETVLHIYSGMGALGLASAMKSKEFFGVDTNETSIAEARANAQHGKLSNVNFSAENPIEWLERASTKRFCADVVVVEPPKTTLQEELLDAIFALKPKKIVYLSARPEEQAKDVSKIVSAGYKMKACVPVDVFPHTNNCECVMMFQNR